MEKKQYNNTDLETQRIHKQPFGKQSQITKVKPQKKEF